MSELGDLIGNDMKIVKDDLQSTESNEQTLPVETEQKQGVTEVTPAAEPTAEIKEDIPLEAEEKPWEFKVDKFNERYKDKLEKPFESADQIGEFFEKRRDNDKYREEINTSLRGEIENEYKERFDNLNKTLEERDIVKHLGGVEQYKEFMIAKKLGQNINQSMLKDVMSGKVDGYNDISKAAASLMLKNKNLTTEMALQIVYKEAGADLGDDGQPLELTPFNNAMLSQAGIKASEHFDNIKSMDIPEISSLEESQKENEEKRKNYISTLTNQWEGKLADILTDFDGIGATENESEFEELKDFKFSAGAEEKKLIKEAIMNDILSSGAEATNENIDMVRKDVIKRFEFHNYRKIEAAKLRHQKNRLIEKNHDDVHNPAPINKNTNPAPDDVPNLAEVQMGQLGSLLKH